MGDLGDYKIIVYIVLAILYFLFTGKKKTEKKSTPPVIQKELAEDYTPVSKPKSIVSQSRPSSSRPIPTSENSEPYSSLEDILKQFGQTPEKSEFQEIKEVKIESLEKPKISVVDYDDNLEDEAEKFKRNENLRKVSNEDLNKEQHLVPYVTEEYNRNKYAEMLKDPEGAKAAFIAGEIFNRKF